MKQSIGSRIKPATIVCAVICALLLLGNHAYSAMPNTFSSGTQAKAAEVNANFTYLENLINALTTQLANQAVPRGTVVAFAGVTPPAGWLLCDGSAVSRTTYAELYAVIGSIHGSGDNVSTFNLPDYRGRFLRGVDGTAGRDSDKTTRTAMNTGGNTGNAVGSVQGDQHKSHSHSARGVVSGGTWRLSGSGTIMGADSSSSEITSNSGIQADGGNETRPLNAYVNYIIKY